MMYNYNSQITIVILYKQRLAGHREAVDPLLENSFVKFR